MFGIAFGLLSIYGQDNQNVISEPQAIIVA
jgi:hypothetical protein